MKKTILAILLISVSILILFTSISLFRQEKVKFRFTRKYSKPPELINEFTISVSKPGGIRVFHDTVYIYDFGTNVIKKYSPNGSLLLTIEDSSKRFVLIKNFEIDSAAIKIIDVRNNGVFRYDQYTKKIRFDSIGLIYDGAWAGGGNILLSSFDPVARDICLQNYNEASARKETIPSPFEKFGDEGSANFGFFKKCNGQTIYTLYQLGKFYVIDSLAKRISTVLTIDGYNKPPETIREGSRTFVDRKSMIINRDGASDSKFAYIISNIRSVSDSNVSISSVIFDAYDLNSRSYHHSFLLEKEYGKFDDIFIEGEILYVLTGNHVQRYKL